MITFEQAFHDAVTVPGDRVVPPGEEAEAVFDWTIEFFEDTGKEEIKNLEEIVEEKDEEISSLQQDLKLAEDFIKALGE